jgi:hypothetical protein
MKEQYVIAGTQRAASNRAPWPRRSPYFSSIWNDPVQLLRGQHEDPACFAREMACSICRPPSSLFGGFGSKVMYYLLDRLNTAGLPLQLILICGRNEKLAAKLRVPKWKIPVHVVGFTNEVHKLMRAADFLIGKPGPGSIAEAMARKLPVLIGLLDFAAGALQRGMGDGETRRHCGEKFSPSC